MIPTLNFTGLQTDFFSEEMYESFSATLSCYVLQRKGFLKKLQNYLFSEENLVNQSFLLCNLTSNSQKTLDKIVHIIWLS